MPPQLTIQTLRVLAAMLDRPCDEWYGLELLRETGLKSGTIYPLLARLEGANWIESRNEEVDPAHEGRPRRRLYQFTERGLPAAKAALEEQLATLGVARARGSRLRNPLPKAHPA
jgi:DNA-binding PadR family transcriptional regulator